MEAFSEKLHTGELWSEEGSSVPDEFVQRLAQAV